MKEYELRSILYGYLKDIYYDSQLQISVTSEYQKKYLQYKIEDKINECINTLLQYSDFKESVESIRIAEMKPQSRQFTQEELASYDGSGGKPAYVAVNGTVYDVSDKIQWAGGTHFGLYAGKNVTNDYMSCHQGVSAILNSLPKVGVLINT